MNRKIPSNFPIGSFIIFFGFDLLVRGNFWFVFIETYCLLPPNPTAHNIVYIFGVGMYTTLQTSMHSAYAHTAPKSFVPKDYKTIFISVWFVGIRV